MENLNFEQIVNVIAVIAPIINSLISNWNKGRNKRTRKRKRGVRY
ncbi:hypothetical protein SAMN05421593_1210 [Chryseobacterium culicis]|uniref:Uncharacterized protein n=1 Tax=Chryseobacterium culicis TaxID=680127 RepID=A0A1H6H2H1_CHRCI|nr:hypothetical protein SAMN05421593_1210 [Chryseobacterium culicis]